MSLGAFRDTERGATAITLMITLVVLMGFAAIAVDGAAAWALRRQDQSAADTGAVAGAIFTARLEKAAAMQAAETEIIRITYITLSPEMSATAWTDEWAGCSDPAKPARFTETASSDCISFTSNLSELRVQTPIVPWMTSFARVIGFDRVNTSAAAHVLTNIQGSGGVLPFGMPGVATTTSELCLKTGANPQNVSPCDGPDTGNFSFLDFTQFGNPTLDTATVCQGGGTERLERNIAQGVDHPLGTTTDPSPPFHTDRDACLDGNFNARPYQVATKTGNVAQALHAGFVDGVAGLPGRLAQGSNLISVRGDFLDDTPLWTFLNANGQALCGSINTHDEMLACLNGYSPSDGIIFDSALGKTPRFGWVPLFQEPTLGAGATTLTILEFRPIFIQTTFWGCNASGCSLEWDPAEGVSPGPINKRVEAATALAIPFTALPTDIREVRPGTDGQVAYLISR
jgi:Flp pilus assembly protein TadG